MRRRNLTKQAKTINKEGVVRYILFGTLAVLAVTSIFMTVETATSGVEISNLRQKESELAMEKRNLEGILVKSLSVNNLEESSGQLGYIKPSVMVYVQESQEAMAKLP